MKRLTVLTLLLAAVVSSPAAAATISAQGETAVLVAGPGEVNDVLVSVLDGALVVRDLGAPPVAGAGCVAIDAGHVRCEAATALLAALGDGDDRLVSTLPQVTAYGEAGDDRLTGGPRDDVLSGGPGADQLDGGAGDDRLAGDGEALEDGSAAAPAVRGPDRLDGGAGRDEVSYRGRTDDLTVSLARGTGPDGDRLTRVEDVTGGAGDDSLIGDARGNVLAGGEGDDRLTGGRGDDRLLGEAGRNVVRGGPGEDQIDARGANMDAGACGRGIDAVMGPRRGVTMLGADCERVLTSTDQFAILLDARPSNVRGRQLRLDVACPQTGSRCLVGLRIRTRGAGSVPVAAGRLRLADGSAAQMRMRLTRAGQTLVRRARPRTLTVVSTLAGDRLGWTARWRPPARDD